MKIKKLLALILVTVLSVATLTACGGNNSGGNGGDAEPKNALERIQQAGKIVMGTSPDYAPYEFLDPNKTGQEAFVGSDVELGRYIAEKLGVEFEVKAMDFGAILVGVNAGEVDIGISGFAPKPDRQEQFQLSKGYNKSESNQSLMIRIEDKDQYKTLDDFKGKVLAVQNGSLQKDLADAQIVDYTPEYVTSLVDGVMMLLSERVDALVISGNTGQGYCNNYDGIQMCGIKFDYESSGTVVAAKKGEVELIEAINEIIDDVNENGLYKQWLADAQAYAASLAEEGDGTVEGDEIEPGSDDDGGGTDVPDDESNPDAGDADGDENGDDTAKQ